MKIALSGYGKMGKIIERIALDRKHEIVLIINQQTQNDINAEDLQEADAIIEFSTPDAALKNIHKFIAAGIPAVIGTTGWYDHIEEIKAEVARTNGSLLYASNFSVGVNIFFHVNKMLAKLMNNYPYYEVQVEEIHHTQKLDAPSGTAITIAEDIISGLDAKHEWKNVLTDGSTPVDDTVKNNQVLIESLRIENVPGTHTVLYDSEVDSIEFKHTAHNRNGFALGAVLAAEWLHGKTGFYTAKDMFSFDA